jgi:23S rRNA pseudouridine2605 synthase
LRFLLKNSKYNFMAKKAFDKFINKPVSGAKKKEIIRQDKKKIKAEERAEQKAKSEQINKHNEGKYGLITADVKKAASERPEPGSKKHFEAGRGKSAEERGGRGGGRSEGGERRTEGKGKFGGDRKKAEPRARTYGGAERNTESKGRFGGNDKKAAGPDRKKIELGSKKPTPVSRSVKEDKFDSTEKRTESRGKKYESDERRPESKGRFAGNDRKTEAPRGKKPEAGDRSERKAIPVAKKFEAGSRSTDRKPAPGGRKFEAGNRPGPKAGPAFKKKENPGPDLKTERPTTTRHLEKPLVTAKKEPAEKEFNANGDPIMALNKFVAHAGVCGRREAALLVKDGHVIVNGDKVLEPGFKVSVADKITVKGKPIFPQKNLVYILLNKPKDYLTTAKDPEGRKTVLDLIKGATQERVYPVGRLDRNTTGVLLLTNDGELAQKLTHPSYEIKKVYEVKLDKPLTKKDYDSVLDGITLEDGFVRADSLAYADAKDKAIIGIEIHSGRNRIVRRIFEHLGYDVKGLDRVMFANLTKKNVDRNKWRLLNEKEVRLLKFMNQSFVRKEKKDA